MSRNAISANPEHYIFKIFRGSMPRTPRRPKTFFLAAAWLKIFFQDRLPPKQKILDRTLQNKTITFLCICSDPGRNSDLSSNQCSLGSTYVNTNLSVDPFDAIFDPTGNPVFQNETWDGRPIKCGQN